MMKTMLMKKANNSVCLFVAEHNVDTAERKRFVQKAIEHFQIGWQLFLVNPDDSWSGGWRIHPMQFEKLMELAREFQLTEELQWLTNVREIRIRQMNE